MTVPQATRAAGTTAGIYAATASGRLSPAAAGARPLLYVPNSFSRSVDEVDPVSGRFVRRLRVGKIPQHVVPSWDLATLWVLNDHSNTVTALDARTGSVGRTLSVLDPYNLYFTPDGRVAIVVEETRQTLAFRDPQTMRLVQSLKVRCPGLDHADFSADGSYLIASCEFSARLVKVDLVNRRVLGYLSLPGGSPQDVKLDPTGKTFYVADRYRGGVHLIDGDRFTEVGFIPTGADAHGLYPSRDAQRLYVSNRRGGSISVIAFSTRRVIATWQVGGSPDMGGVSIDGKTLWLTGRYSGAIYAIDTVSGKVLRRIGVGRQPHGMAVWPQPGRFSLGHTGNMR